MDDTILPGALPITVTQVQSLPRVHLIDVRRAAARAESGWRIAGTPWHDPAGPVAWADTVPKGESIVVYCVFGHQVSQGVCAALRAAGHDARFLAGGFTAWRDAGLPVEGL